MQTERYPLPFGWVKEFDQTSGLPFYVDTKATPPRSIWTHPYEDEEYLKAHPEVREKVKAPPYGGSDSNLLPPPSFEESQRRHSSGGGRPSQSSQQSQSTGTPVAGSSNQKPRGALGAIKDHLFGTKEERKAEKIRRKERARALWEAQRQRDIAEQEYYAQNRFNHPQYGYDSRGFGGAPYGGGGFGNQRRGGGGLGGIGLPLVGGLVGGLLLGDLLDGGFGGGDFGGGDFGGGF